MKTLRARCPFPLLIVVLFLVVLVGCSQGGEATHSDTPVTPNEEVNPGSTIHPSRITDSPGEETAGLAAVKHWLYLLDSDLDEELLQQIAVSLYDMVVLDYVPSESDREEFPMAQVVERLHAAPHPKLVLAYIDIAEAESFRTYWNEDWRIGDPDWILGDDPDGWADDFPVAFWHEDWQSIWMGEDGLLRQILDTGYDGVYLDWVAAYEDEIVIEAARRDAVDAKSEMIAWVDSISRTIRPDCERCVIVAQNPADLVEDDEFRRSIDAVAQEHVWFDGGVDNRPQGDCPLPRTEDEIDTDVYRESLSAVCRRQFDDFPAGTLHDSSEEYLEELSFARSQGLVVFSVDYALDPENILWILRTSRSFGFVPFVGARALDRYVEIVD